jgi:hypothetical protein
VTHIPEKREPKIIQIAICPDTAHAGNWPDFFVLRDDGSILNGILVCKSPQDPIQVSWRRLPEPPAGI